MTVNRELFTKTNFTIAEIPQWLCPICNIGVLTNGFMREKEDRESLIIKRGDDYDGFSEAYNFVLELICSNPRCGDAVYCTGFLITELITRNDLSSFDGGLVEVPEKVYYPKFFYPPLNLFIIPEKCDKKVKELVESSFGNIFYDYSSCGNKVRVSLEYLMNYLKIRKQILTRRNKMRKLKLGERIQLLKALPHYKKIGDLIDAIKWIGNDGSHDDSLKPNDILDAYEMLEIVLNDIYSENEKILTAKAKKIIKHKKPLSKIKIAK